MCLPWKLLGGFPRADAGVALRWHLPLQLPLPEAGIPSNRDMVFASLRNVSVRVAWKLARSGNLPPGLGCTGMVCSASGVPRPRTQGGSQHAAPNTLQIGWAEKSNGHSARWAVPSKLQGTMARLQRFLFS